MTREEKIQRLIELHGEFILNGMEKDSQKPITAEHKAASDAFFGFMTENFSSTDAEGYIEATKSAAAVMDSDNAVEELAKFPDAAIVLAFSRDIVSIRRLKLVVTPNWERFVNLYEFLILKPNPG